MSRGPGKWQRLILRNLEARPCFSLRQLFDGRPSASQWSAAHRAARQLAAEGKCETGLLWSDDDQPKGRRLETVVCRPGHVFQGGKRLKDLCVERVPGRHTFNLYPGSLRHIAAREGVSVATVRRDLAMAKQQGK
jgi:hypothetical protein